MNRPGYYWVKWSKITSWVIAEMTTTKKGGDMWWPFGGHRPYDYIPAKPEVIGKRIEEPKEPQQ